jgi:hypothetical protein
MVAALVTAQRGNLETAQTARKAARAILISILAKPPRQEN